MVPAVQLNGANWHYNHAISTAVDDGNAPNPAGPCSGAAVLQPVLQSIRALK